MKSRLDAVCRWTHLDGRQTAVRSGAEKSRRLDGRLDGRPDVRRVWRLLAWYTADSLLALRHSHLGSV